jgi:hypothetical protein
MFLMQENCAEVLIKGLLWFFFYSEAKALLTDSNFDGRRINIFFTLVLLEVVECNVHRL